MTETVDLVDLIIEASNSPKDFEIYCQRINGKLELNSPSSKEEKDGFELFGDVDYVCTHFNRLAPNWIISRETVGELLYELNLKASSKLAFTYDEAIEVLATYISDFIRCKMPEFEDEANAVVRAYEILVQAKNTNLHNQLYKEYDDYKEKYEE